VLVVHTDLTLASRNVNHTAIVWEMELWQEDFGRVIFGGGSLGVQPKGECGFAEVESRV
jgi:hypothetical protein